MNPADPPLLLDASCALAWLIARTDPGEARIADEALLATQQRGAIIPEMWWLEVVNDALVSERRGGNRQKSTYFFESLSRLPIQEDDRKSRLSHPTILDLARTHALTSYDAVYLELALRLRGQFATFDRKLAQAARAAGVSVFGDPS